jgi:hypothetical protein
MGTLFPGGYNLATLFLGGYKFGDLAHWVVGVANETVKYGHELCGAWTQRVTALARPRSNCTSKLQTHLIVREGTPHQETHNYQTVKEQNLVMGPR